MKLLMTVLAITMGLNTLASAATRGYVYTDRRGDYWFDGINDAGQSGSGFKIDFALQMGSITEKTFEAMMKCMAKKQTHAILLEVSGSIPQQLDMPQRQIRMSTYKVTCVPAPGFLQFWREQMKAN